MLYIRSRKSPPPRISHVEMTRRRSLMTRRLSRRIKCVFALAARTYKKRKKRRVKRRESESSRAENCTRELHCALISSAFEYILILADSSLRARDHRLGRKSSRRTISTIARVDGFLEDRVHAIDANQRLRFRQRASTYDF